MEKYITLNLLIVLPYEKEIFTLSVTQNPSRYMNLASAHQLSQVFYHKRSDIVLISPVIKDKIESKNPTSIHLCFKNLSP